MSTTTVGPVYPGYASSSDWSNFTVARLGADDASYASAAVPAGYQTETGWTSGYVFTIPVGSVITKVKATVEHYRTGGGLFVEVYGWSSWALSFATTPTVESKEWTTGLPTVAQLNAGSIEVDFMAWTTTSSRSFYVDYVRLEATYYTPAVVTTDAASDVTSTTATCGGEVTSDGSGTVIGGGVCWNMSGSPTIADSYTTDADDVEVFTSSLTDLWPSTTYHVRSWAATEDGIAYGPEVTFATLASTSRSLVARPFTTRAAAAELVARQGDAIIDWWIEDDVVRAEVRPTAVADIPRDRWYVVSRDTPGASVSVKLDSEDTPDIIFVLYSTFGVTNVRDGSIRSVYYPSAPTSVIDRVQTVNLVGQYMGEADALTHAKNLWDRSCADAMEATITAVGGLYTVDGAFRPSPLIMAGDWIDVLDLPGHTPAYITGSSYSRNENMVTITVGSTEQSDLVIPGMSALPQAVQVYGVTSSYDSYDSYDSGTIDEPVTPGMPPPPDPGMPPTDPVTPAPNNGGEGLVPGSPEWENYYLNEWYL